MLKVIIRADASLLIGKGHIMRCLTLADKIKAHQCDAEITFMTTPHFGHLDTLIVEKGYNVISLPSPATKLEKNNTSSWLGCTQEEDASACLSNIKTPYDILIVDHYAIDIVWHKLMRNCCEKIMVIDDLANRHYDCDILLDQTLSRNPIDYKSLTPITCLTITGSKYTLLRPEFATTRSKAKQKRKQLKYLPSNFHVLISLGGFDEDNISQMFINALKSLHIEGATFTATLVLSSQSEHLVSIKHAINALPWLTLNLDCSTMSAQMLKADIAIGASGATAWERCCLGLPTLSIETASNQQLVSASLAQRGAIINIGDSQFITQDKIINALNNLISSDSTEIENLTLYERLVKNSFDCCDGKGTERLYKTIMQKLALKSHNGLTLKRADKDDVDIIFKWQSNAEIRKFSRNNKPIEYQEHCHWFSNAISSSNRTIYLIHYESRISGMLRLDDIDDTSCEVSILIDPQEQGKGIALKALNTLTHLGIHRVIHAYVHEDNVSSHKLFTKSNFSKISATKYCLFPFEIKERDESHAK